MSEKSKRWKAMAAKCPIGTRFQFEHKKFKPGVIELVKIADGNPVFSLVVNGKLDPHKFDGTSEKLSELTSLKKS